MFLLSRKSATISSFEEESMTHHHIRRGYEKSNNWVNPEDPRHEEQEDSLISDHSLVEDGSLDINGKLANKSKTGGWKAARLIFGVELCERIATLGLQRNLVTYFVNEMHISIPKSANMVSNFVGALYLAAFLGGFVADSYLGRFLAILIFAIVQVLGMILLTLSASIPILKPHCTDSHCPEPQASEMAVLLTGLYLIALGNGGIKPNVSSMGADQFDEHDPSESYHMPKFFNWFYFIISIGSLLSVTVFVYLQDNVGFSWGFGIPSFLMMVAIIIFFAGAPLYRYKVPMGSPLTHMAQVVTAAVHKCRISYPHDPHLLYEDEGEAKGKQKIAHSNQFLFLDRAAIILPKDEEILTSVSKWKLCTVTQVEEVKMVLRLLPIWASTFFVWTALSQMETFSVEQGAIMKRNIGPHFKFPPASLAVFELVNVLIFLPLYDKYFVPLARKYTGHEQGITSLQRIGVGIVTSTLSMVVAALVEMHRLRVAREYGLLDEPKATVPMSIFWLVPQYFLRGTTEIFTQIGQLEFFYKESPVNMRGLGTALYLSTIAMGHFLSSIAVSTVNKYTEHGSDSGWLTNNLNQSKLDYYYWLLALLNLLNFFFYLLCSRWYRYKTLANSSKNAYVEESM